MTGLTIKLGGKRLSFSSCESGSVPDKSYGLIYPHRQGIVITDDRCEARLLIVTDEGGDFCWFVSGRRHSGKYRITHTTSDDEKEFGLDKLKYSEVIELATRIYHKCQRYLATTEGYKNVGPSPH